MNNQPIYVTREDYSKLRLLIEAIAGPTVGGKPIQKLRAELDRAMVVDPSAIPPTVVTMNSRVEIEDLSTGEVDDYILTFPERANVEQKMLSVLAPIGTAILGYREGDEVSWSTPGGIRQLKIRRVVQPDATAVTSVP